MAECPTSIEELDELERLLPLCRVTLYNQAKARIESGAAKSVSEAARQLADETGKNVDGIRRRIFEEAKRDGGVRPAQIAGTSKFNPYQSEKSPYASSANKPVSESEQEIDDDLDDEPEQDILQQETPSHQEQPRYNHRALGTGENEWYTPSEYIDAVKTVFGEIDLDPASSEHAQKTISANSFYTIEDDGLTQKWYGNVWMNPPYTQPEIKHFIQKLVDEYNSGNVTQAIALTHNYR